MQEPPPPQIQHHSILDSIFPFSSAGHDVIFTKSSQLDWSAGSTETFFDASRSIIQKESGWSATPAVSNVPENPFRISRTNNKPYDGIGFLPVYAKFRKDGTKATAVVKRIGGDKDSFFDELRAVLEIHVIRYRAGGTIGIDGNRAREVMQWLAGLGF